MSLYSYVIKIYYTFKKKKKEKYLKDLVKKGLILGQNVDIVDTFFIDPSHCFLISIGDNCTICPNVRLIAHDASTKRILGYTKIARINIKKNCFLGESAIVLPGVSIGSNTIVAAGAVVTRGDIPANTIVAGNPAKVISTIDVYTKKIADISKNKKIFNENYNIEKLDIKKRKEIVSSIGDTFGFIK